MCILVAYSKKKTAKFGDFIGKSVWIFSQWENHFDCLNLKPGVESQISSPDPEIEPREEFSRTNELRSWKNH